MAQLVLFIDGVPASQSPLRTQPLVRSVIISLFSWRRANPGDQLPGTDRMGWWADAFGASGQAAPSDRIGSRLWLLSRTTITATTPRDAEGYAREALQRLLDDGVVGAISVSAVRNGLDRIDLAIAITKTDGTALAVRFDNVWEFLRAL